MARRLKRDAFFGLNTTDPIRCGDLREFHEAQAIRNVRLNVKQGMTVRPGREIVGNIRTYGVSGDIELPRVVYNATSGYWDAYCAAVEGSTGWLPGNYHNDHDTYPDKKYCNFCSSMTDVIAVGTATAAVVASREPKQLLLGADDLGFDGTEDIHCIYLRYKPAGGSYYYYTMYVADSNFSALVAEIYALVGNKSFVYAYSVFEANGAAADYTFNENALTSAGLKLWGTDGAGGERVDDDIVNEDTAHSIDYFMDSYGYNHVLVSAGKYIYDDQTLELGTYPTVSLGGLTADQRAAGCSHQKFFWYANGTDVNMKFDGVQWTRMGIAAPAAGPTVVSAGAGGVLTGEYQYAYSYVRKFGDLGYETESKLSPVTIFTATAETAEITVLADPTGEATHARVYRRSSDRLDWRQVPFSFGATTTWDVELDEEEIDFDDVNLEDDLLDTALEYPNEGEPLGIDLAPVAFDGVVAWKSRLWGWKGKYLYHTVPGRPEKWWNDSSDYKPWLIDTKDNQDIVGVASVGEYLLVFTPDNAYYIPGEDRDEDSFNVLILENAFGCVAARSIVDCSGTLMWLSKEGVYSFTPGVGVRNMSRPIDRDFYGRGIALLDSSVSTLQYAAGLYLEDEKLYLLSVPRHGSAQNIQTFVYNFGMPKMRDLSRWSLYDFGFRDACRSNDKRVYSLQGNDGTYWRENYGTRDNGNRILSYYTTRFYDFDQSLFDKRLLEISANGSGRGYPMKITTIVDVPDYGYYEDSDDLKEDGGGEGAGYIVPADDWEGSDPADTPVVLDGEVPRLRHMSNLPQELCGLFAGFRIDIAYEQDVDPDVLWEKIDPNTFTYTEKTYVADLPMEDTIIKIDPVGGMWYLHTQGSKYTKMLHDKVGKRTFILHSNPLTEATNAIITIINHKHPAGSSKHIEKINATATGWPTAVSAGSDGLDIAYNPDLQQLAIAIPGYASAPTYAAPGIIILDVRPGSSTYRQVLATRRAPSTTVNVGSSVSCRFVRYDGGKWWCWFECYRSTSRTATPYNILGYFNTSGTWTTCAFVGDGIPPASTNIAGELYDEELRVPNSADLDRIRTDPGPLTGTTYGYLGDPVQTLMSIDSFEICGEDIILTQHDGVYGSISGGIVYDHAYPYGLETFIYRINIDKLLEDGIFPAVIAEGQFEIESELTEIGSTDYWTTPNYPASNIRRADVTLNSDACGGIRVYFDTAHTGSMSAVSKSGDGYVSNCFGTAHASPSSVALPGGGFAREWSTQCFYDAEACDNKVGVAVVFTNRTRTLAEGAFTLVYTYRVHPIISGLVEVIGVHSDPPIIQSDDTDMPLTEEYERIAGDATSVLNVASRAYTTKKQTRIDRGIAYWSEIDTYVFPISSEVSGVLSGLGLWRYMPGDPGTLNRLVAADTDLEYDYVGSIEAVQEVDGYVAIASNDSDQDNLSVQLYNANTNTFNEQKIDAALGYSTRNAIGVFYDPRNAIWGFMTGFETALDGEIWIYRTQSPIEMYNDGSTYYDIFIDEADPYGDGSGPLVGNAFHGFEIAYTFDKRPHF